MNDIVKIIKDRIKANTAHLEKLKRDQEHILFSIDQLEETLSLDLAALSVYETAALKKPQVKNHQGNQLNPEIEERLNLKGRMESTMRANGYPLNSIDLRKYINEQFPDNPAKESSWSALLSMTIKKHPKVFKKYEVGQKPKKHYYGLKEWFKGDELKDEAKKKFDNAYSKDIPMQFVVTQ